MADSTREKASELADRGSRQAREVRHRAGGRLLGGAFWAGGRNVGTVRPALTGR